MSDFEEYRKSIKYLAENKIGDIFLNKGDAHAKIVFSSLFMVAGDKVRIFAEKLNSYVPNCDEYVSSMRLFLEKGGEVHILLEGEPNINTPLFEMLRNFNKQVNIKVTGYRPKFGDDLINFCTVDDFAYRMETDKQKKVARGSFYDKKQTAQINKVFDLMYNDDSKSIAFDVA